MSNCHYAVYKRIEYNYLVEQINAMVIANSALGETEKEEKVSKKSEVKLNTKGWFTAFVTVSSDADSFNT